MKISIQQIRLLLSVFLMLVSCYVFYLLYNQVKTNHAISEDMNLKWQEETQRRDETGKLARGLKTVELEKTELEKHFAKNSDLVPFLNTMEDLGVKAGVSVETTAVDVSPDKLGLMVGLKARGSFPATYKFITLLENSPYELEFQSLDIFRAGGEGGTEWQSTVEIKLLSFIN